MKDQLILPRTPESVPTPRSRENSGIVLPKGAPKIISSDKFRMLLKKYDETKKLDLQDFNSAAEIGAFIDFYNNTVVKNRQKDYEREITGMNEYYWKLWLRSMQE